jgi:hypothetical protein
MRALELTVSIPPPAAEPRPCGKSESAAREALLLSEGRGAANFALWFFMVSQSGKFLFDANVGSSKGSPIQTFEIVRFR